MMIECEIHGLSFAVKVSPDIKKQIDSLEHINSFIIIDYDFEGDIAHSYYLSEEFAKKYGFTGDTTTPLPDDYPEWVHLMDMVCEKCFMEFANVRMQAGIRF